MASSVRSAAGSSWPRSWRSWSRSSSWSAITTPLGTTGVAPLTDPRATPFLIGTPTEGLQPGALAPELTIALPDGGTYQLTDLDGKPIRLADLRGKVVWLNFWASWCPPCQPETPILRDLSERYRDRGLEIVGVSVQETTPADIAAYAARYQLEYTIGFDASGTSSTRTRSTRCRRSSSSTPNGVIRASLNGPVDEAARPRSSNRSCRRRRARRQS